MKNPIRPIRASQNDLRLVYLYLKSLTKGGPEELHLIQWLTAFDDTTLQQLMAENATFGVFQRASLQCAAITSVICGYRVRLGT
jgi:hypothetical protein